MDEGKVTEQQRAREIKGGKEVGQRRGSEGKEGVQSDVLWRVEAEGLSGHTGPLSMCVWLSNRETKRGLF